MPSPRPPPSTPGPLHPAEFRAITLRDRGLPGVTSNSRRGILDPLEMAKSPEAAGRRYQTPLVDRPHSSPPPPPHPQSPRGQFHNARPVIVRDCWNASIGLRLFERIFISASSLSFLIQAEGGGEGNGIIGFAIEKEKKKDLFLAFSLSYFLSFFLLQR